MTVVEAFDPNEIRLTDNAASKVRALVEDEGNPSSKAKGLYYRWRVLRVPIRLFL